MPYTRNGLNLLASAASYPSNDVYGLRFDVDKLIGAGNSWDGESVEFNGEIYFQGYDGNTYKLMKYNPINKEVAVVFELYAQITSMKVYNDLLYIGLNKNLIVTDGINGYTLIGVAASVIKSIELLNGEIYIATTGSTSNIVYRYNGDGRFTSVGTIGTSTSTTICIIEFNGELYGFNGNGNNYDRLYKYNGISTWDIVASFTSISSVGSMLKVFNGELYGFCSVNSGGSSNTGSKILKFIGNSWVTLSILNSGYTNTVIRSVAINRAGDELIVAYGNATRNLAIILSIVDGEVVISDEFIVNILSTGLMSYCDDILYCGGSGTQQINKLITNGVINYVDTTGKLRNGTIETTISKSLGQEYLEAGNGIGDFSLDNYKMNLLVGWGKGTTTRVTTFDSVNNKLITSITRTFTNSTGADAEITELGLYVYLLNPNGSFLMYREKLENPIIVLANETVTLEVKLEVAYQQ